MCRLAVLPVTLAVVLVAALESRAVEITAEPSEGGVVVKIDGSLFAEYLRRSGNKPILWPILGPTGKPMTRAYPMVDLPKGKTDDHPHQRSFWFTHGSVNGVSFWEEGSRAGSIVHRRFVEVASGREASVVTENDWLAPGGKKVCEDVRRLKFGVEGEARWIDFDITLKATAGPVTFGDTKEGTFGVRVADTMKVEPKRGGMGKIVNSEGQADDRAWGCRAAWVDYYGPVDGQVVGIAILNHPDSFRFPTPWHVRAYGLFAANPFGLHDFPGGEKADGTHRVPAGQSISLYYRVWLHKGDTKEGKVGEAYRAYARTPRK
jgi:hypothetical protein